ncbi:MAG: ABC transporter substrate-binding protein [Chloroflexota bacterium]|nr:ABC transporter substrate-binding protein [Chloroflexota bacterium]
MKKRSLPTLGPSFLSLSVLLVLALLTASCVAPSGPVPAAPLESGEAPAAAPEASTLRVALDIPVQLDPAFASSDSEIAILNAVYDYLVDIDHENKVQPRLASAARISADGLNYTLEIDPDATFHDGSPVTAADVIWTFNRLRDPEAGLPTSDLYSNITDIFTVPNSADPSESKTVVFQLIKPDPFFQFNLSDNHALVVKEGTEDFTQFNGSGPFKVADYRPENRMDLVANEDYFIDGKPGVEAVEFIFFSDQAASVDALRGGQVDLVMRMPTPLFLTLEQEEGINTVSIPTNGFDLVRLRSDREPGNDPRVVEAFKLATDRNAIFEQVTLGLGAVGRDSPIGPLYVDYYSEETPVKERDTEAAKALLADAGYPDGLEMTIHVPDSGDRPDLAVVLKEQWAEAGINVDVSVEPESVYYGDNGWLEADLGITGWGSRPIPQFYLDVMLKCGAKWNESHFCDEEFDRLAELAGTTLNEEERTEAYHDIQTLLLERGPVIIPYFFAQLGAISDQFDGFNMKAFAGRTDLAGIQPVQ